MKAPMLLRRFPSWWPRITFWPAIPEGERATYPSLADDFAVLDREVSPQFEKADRAALHHQHRHRRQQVVILLGAALVSVMGAVQAAIPDQRWPGLLLAVLGIVLAAMSRSSAELGALNEFLTDRVKAERLRALHFRFLSRTAAYAGDDREVALRRAVAAIDAGLEPS